MTRRKQIRPKKMNYTGDGKEEEGPGDKQSVDGSEGEEEGEEEGDKISGDTTHHTSDNHISEPAAVLPTDSDAHKPDDMDDLSDSNCDVPVRGERLDEVGESSPPSGVERVTPQSPPETPPPKSRKIGDAAPMPISRKEMLLNRNKESSHKSQSHSESSASPSSFSTDVDMLLKLVDNVHTRVGSPVKESPIKSLSNLNERISSITMRSKPVSRGPVVDQSAMYYHHKHQSPTSKSPATYLPQKSPSPSARERPLPPYSPYTPPANPPSGDQPLDLSTKPKSSKDKTSSSKYSINFSSKEGASTKDVNSLANLEKKFGGNSFLLDKIGKTPPSTSHRNAFMSAFGVNLYSSAIYSSHPLIPQAQLRPSPTEISLPKKSHGYPSSEASAMRKTSYSTVASAGKFSTSVTEVQSAREMQDKKHTNLQCSCGKEFETLYQLTIHLQDTGHPPFKARSASHQDYPKLVRGQDMWLNQGSEQTRQILRCMQCGESFKSLPELTVHMMQTKHYTNIVGPESHKKMQKMSNASLSDSSDNETSYVKCQLCHENFDDTEGLAMHISSVHNKKCTTIIPEHSIKSERVIASPHTPVHYSPIPRERNGCVNDGTIDKLKRRLSQSSDDQPARKTPRRDSQDSNGYDVPEHSKIRCENCAEKIDTDKFVEHVRVCVKTSDSETRGGSRKRMSSERELGRARSRSRSRSSTPQTRLPLEDPLNGDFVVKQEKMETEPDSSEAAEADMVHSSTELVTPPPLDQAQSSASALKAMENFIERSFTLHSAKKPNHHHHQAGYFDPSRLMRTPFMPHSNLAKNYIQEPLPVNKSATPVPTVSTRDSQAMSGTNILSTVTTSGSDSLYQNKYLPPTYMAAPSPARASPASSPADLSTITTKAREEKEVTSSNHSSPRPPSVGSAHRESPSPSSDKPVMDIKKERDTDNEKEKQDKGKVKDNCVENPTDKKSCENSKNDSKYDKKGKESPKKAILEKYICESPSSAKSESSAAGGKSPDRGSSALESLQGLVYGKSFNTEHPLDSLQKLIHSTNYNTSQHEMSRHNGMALAATSAIQQALPGTVILVNPVVTVMPSIGGGSPSVSITIPPDSGASPTSKDSKESPHSPGDKALSDTEGEGNGEYRCQACKRHFASKGSYRYHLSRCHVLSTVKKYQIKESINSSPYVYLPLDHTAKFNKYYEMANELANKGK